MFAAQDLIEAADDVMLDDDSQTVRESASSIMRERYQGAIKTLLPSLPRCDLADVESRNFDCAQNSYFSIL